MQYDSVFIRLGDLHLTHDLLMCKIELPHNTRIVSVTRAIMGVWLNIGVSHPKAPKESRTVFCATCKTEIPFSCRYIGTIDSQKLVHFFESTSLYPSITDVQEIEHIPYEAY